MIPHLEVRNCHVIPLFTFLIETLPVNGDTTTASFSTPQPPSNPPPSSINGAAESNVAAAAESRPPRSFAHAPLSYFALDLLTSKGPRKGADIGSPHDATRKLPTDDTTTALSAGSWWCAAGGWPSPTPRTTTEIFWVLEGHGCVTDRDGTRHYFGPGDTVILPLSWTGRWDVLEPIHKVWCVHEHAPLPKEYSLRAVVRPYHQLLWGDDTDEGVLRRRSSSDGEAYATTYETKYTRVGCTQYPGGTAYEQNNRGATEWWHILEGVMYLTDGVDGAAQRCVPGDTVVVPAGWSGHADIMEPVKKLWVQVAAE